MSYQVLEELIHIRDCINSGWKLFLLIVKITEHCTLSAVMDNEKASHEPGITSTGLDTIEAGYDHAPLDTQGQHVRLFRLWWNPHLKRIEVTLQNFNLMDAPSFRAVSYTWGDDLTLESLYVDGKVIRIRKNLSNFFKVFATKHIKDKKRFPEDKTWLWADQVCVVQTSSSERSHQVQMMDQIFSQAEEVLIWLGNDQAGERGLKSIKEMKNKEEIRPALASYQSSTDSIGLRDFANNPYWDRLWIVQEIVLAKKLTIFMRGSILDEAKFELFCLRVLRYTTILHNCTLFELIANKRSKLLQGSRKGDGLLLDACYATLFSKCEDPRDKIYGLQGLLAADQRAIIDYDKSTETVFLEAAAKICANNKDKMIYELGWYIIQIAFGMGLLENKEADEFFVIMSKQLEEKKDQQDQMLRLLQLLHEKSGVKGRSLSGWDGVSSEKSEKAKHLAPQQRS